MNYDILWPIVTISGIAIALGIFLRGIVNGSDEKFDERQLIERGRGANLAMFIAFSYLLGLYAGLSFDLIRSEYAAIFAVYGMVTTVLVYSAYCIFRDAFLNRDQDMFVEVVKHILFGGIWMAMAWFIRERDPERAWIDGALALDYLGTGVLLLIRALVLCIQERRTAREDAHG